MLEEEDIRVLRLHRFDDDNSKLRAFADIAIGEFVVRGLRVIQGQEGLFISMPQERGKDGRWYNTFYTKNPKARKVLANKVLEAYDR